MIPVLTAEQMRTLDQTAIEHVGIPSMVLMETAGKAVADSVSRLLQAEPDDRPVLALVGYGSNGGDAVVAARHLENQGYEVTLALLGDPDEAKGDLAAQLAIAERLELPALTLFDDITDENIETLLIDHSVVVDGIFGTGLGRPVEGLPGQVIRLLNDADNSVVAIDLPSGICADTGQVLGIAVEASATVTFALPKLGHVVHPGRSHAGEVEVVDIGIPYQLIEAIEPAASLIDDDEITDAVPPREANSHKGSYGHLLVVAGSPDRPGAALLASRAALRVGTGLVTLGSDDETIRRVAGALDALMGLSLGELLPRSEAVLKALETRTALAIGPSLAPSDALETLLRDVVEVARVPVVLDAGALDVLGPDPRWLAARHFAPVLTPHPGEMARVLRADTAAIQADRIGAARRLADMTGAVVVLKGASTVVAEPDGSVGILTAGNPGMATAGTGDVLTGIIGGLLAQGVAANLAARAGVALHAAAGDRAAELAGVVRLNAPDLIEQLAWPAKEDAE